jgi:DNA-binding NtrC family response regulator
VDDSFSADGLTADKPRTPDSGGRLNLAVIGEGFVASHPLPERGVVVIGRGADADLRIDHESVSRKHVAIYIEDDLKIEDLGSSNGTMLRETALVPGERVSFTAGEMIEVGSVMIVAQRQATTAVRTRRVWSHDAFEARLEEECERTAKSGGTFAVMRVRVAGLASAVVQDVVLEQLRPQDLVAWYGPTDVEILAPEATLNTAENTLQRIRTALAKGNVKVAAAMATYPRDGKSPEVLLGRACDRLNTGVASALVFESPAMLGLHKMLQRVAAGTINVLLLGETGVGKEVIADRLHQLSPRATKAMLKLNCAAFSDTLLESELFGHERGSFTGAVETKKGLLETADGGTVFLDEIGDLPLALQAKLLRVIEERRVMRVGGLEPRPIDVRFIAATHRDLEAAVAQQTFRQDLFYRLNGITLMIPPLRERVEEIMPLAREFTERSARSLSLERTPVLSQEAITLLRSYTWPGNVRELRNVMERAVLLAGTDPITPEHLPIEKMSSVVVQDVAPLRAGVMERERALIIDALERANGNQTEAAKLLGISRRTLVSRLGEYGLPRPRKK